VLVRIGRIAASMMAGYDIAPHRVPWFTSTAKDVNAVIQALALGGLRPDERRHALPHPLLSVPRRRVDPVITLPEWLPRQTGADADAFEERVAAGFRTWDETTRTHEIGLSLILVETEVADILVPLIATTERTSGSGITLLEAQNEESESS
jgi:hypothetical protein